MDPNEILKHGGELLKQAPELAKAAAEVIGAFKFTEITKAMLGPAANEVAERIHDQARLYRFGRQLEMLKKAEKMATEAGFTPKAVPIKLLFPLLEGTSLEEDEDLHTMWAALMANAASPEHAMTVRPGFIATLKQMAPDEAKLLKWIHDHDKGWGLHGGDLKWSAAQSELGFTSKKVAETSRRIDPRMATCLDGLEAQQLVRRTYWLPDSSSSLDEPRKYGYKQVDFTITLTERGVGFLTACQPPKPKS